MNIRRDILFPLHIQCEIELVVGRSDGTPWDGLANAILMKPMLTGVAPSDMYTASVIRHITVIECAVVVANVMLMLYGAINE